MSKIYSVIVGIILLAIWEIICGGYGSSYLGIAPYEEISLDIPPFSAVILAGIEQFENQTLLNAIFDSIFRFVVGFVIGSIVGIVCGFILARFEILARVLDPFLRLFAPISPLAWLPLIIIAFGIGEIGAIFVIVYAVFFPTLALSVAGIRSISPTILSMSENFAANEWLKARYVIFPGAFLHIASGLKLSASVAWIQLVAGEMLGINSGLGYMIIDGRNLLRLDIVILSMLLIGILGYMIHIFFSMIEKIVTRKLGGVR